MRTTGVLLVALALFGYGCASIEKPRPANVDPARQKKSIESHYGADLKSRLDYILERRLNESEAVKVLDIFAIDVYDIQDQNTFWGHRAVAGGGGPYSEYYFTYKNRYFILFLLDKNAVDHVCIDMKMIAKSKKGYELNAGRVVGSRNYGVLFPDILAVSFPASFALSSWR
jgi:hypothetical protein